MKPVIVWVTAETAGAVAVAELVENQHSPPEVWFMVNTFD